MEHEKRRVLVALSGGLDSAAVVLMLKESLRYEVEALYLDITGSAEMRQQAERVAQMVGVPLLVKSAKDVFERQVIAPLLEEHHRGRTPSPCARCNPAVKWAMLCDEAQRRGFDHVATGHYVQIELLDGRPVFTRGVDPTKDQSYYLWAVTEQQKRMAILPLGGMTKRQVRAYLSDRGFEPLATGGESMSLCFLRDEAGAPLSYAEFLTQRIGEQIAPGEVVDTAGHIVGRHNGAPLYTIGQKRGFTIAAIEQFRAGAPSVVGIDTVCNRLVVSNVPQDLFATRMVCEGLVTDHPQMLFGGREDVTVVVRGLGRNPQGYALSIEQLDASKICITLPEPGAWALAPGQPVVFYIGERLIGGAVCVETLR